MRKDQRLLRCIALASICSLIPCALLAQTDSDPKNAASDSRTKTANADTPEPRTESVAISKSPDNLPNTSDAAVPVLSGAIVVVPVVDSGHYTLQSVIAPVLLVPIGKRWLIESRVTFEGDFTHDASNHFGGMVKKEIDYAQLDFIANPYLTISAGRFLTPFGIYNERIYSRWIRNLQTEPLILPLEEDTGNGVMVRGGIQAGENVQALYAASFSALSTVQHLESDRQVGGRFGFFFPKQRVEIGFSAKHFLQDDNSNRYGFHFQWQPPSHPLDLRMEYANSADGHGYWIEPAYRFSEAHFWQPVMGKLQVVARVQQFFLKQPGNGDLPGADTQQFEGGVNYYFHDDLRATASVGRHFSSLGDGNVWTVGFTYRFAIPLAIPVRH